MLRTHVVATIRFSLFILSLALIALPIEADRVVGASVTTSASALGTNGVMSTPDAAVSRFGSAGSAARVTTNVIDLMIDPATDNAGAVAELIAAINTANGKGMANTINLVGCATYTLSMPDNFEYGPNGLPPIASTITIEGNGGTIQRDPAAQKLRLFYVSGGLSFNTDTSAGLPAGSLTLHDLTLKGGLAKGGDASIGGGGMGAGGAIFNQGTLALNAVTLTGNTAKGGSASVVGGGSGGGGIGEDAPTNGNGGGFGGTPLGVGGTGGTGDSSGGGGGGGGFLPGSNGGNAFGGGNGGNGGGLGLLGGDGGGDSIVARGDGGGGGSCFDCGVAGGNGGDFGVGGGRHAGGGVGGGGGDFGGGGFGGGGGESGGLAGFGGGDGGNNGSADGGGGAGLGGAIFNHRGTLTLTNCTLTVNTAQGGTGGSDDTGGSGGSAFGGGLFNLNGTLKLNFCTVANNTVTRGLKGANQGSDGSADGGAVYNLAFGNTIEDGTASTATVKLSNTILATTSGGTNDLVNDKRDRTTTPAIGANVNTASVTFSGNNLAMNSTALNGTSFTGSPTVTSDPQLGGLTTFACKPAVLPITQSSSAFDAGSCDPSIPTDERGVSRPQCGACDIGAFEVECCTITCPANVTQSNDHDQCGALVSYPDPTASPGCGTVGCSPESGSFFPKGTTTVTCSTTGDTPFSCLFTVTVNDTQAPAITCPNNIVTNTDPGQCSAVVNYATPTANDNCDGALPVTCAPASGWAFPKGTITVTCSAMDTSGNKGSCMFTVTVNDTQQPTITCAASQTAAGQASCPIQSATVVNYPNPTVSDNCPGATFSCSPPSGSPLPAGTTTVTCTATDTSGNTAQCTFTVNAFSFCLQDDSNPGNVVLVNAQTGDFSFCCDGVPIASGMGTLTVRGCIGSIDSSKGDRQVHIQWDTSANNGAGAGTAFVQKRSNKIVCQITDKNMSNNTCQCANQPPPASPKKPRT